MVVFTLGTQQYKISPPRWYLYTIREWDLLIDQYMEVIKKGGEKLFIHSLRIELLSLMRFLAAIAVQRVIS